MAKEIERKFLVTNDSFKTMATQCMFIKQGYLSLKKESTVRIRINNDNAYLTIKGITQGHSRDEWEYSIPTEDADAMLEKCIDGRIIEKYRYIVFFNGDKWEIDEFLGEDSGLVLAEIELETEEQQFVLPPFVGEEVTNNPQYYNSSIAGR